MSLQKKYSDITTKLQRSASHALLTAKNAASGHLQDDEELSFLNDEKSRDSEEIDEISGRKGGEEEYHKEPALRQRKLEEKTSSF